MRIAIFFLYLFALLFSGDAQANVGRQDYSFGQHLIQKKHLTTTVHLAPITRESTIIINYTVPGLEKQDIINDNFEDDDTNNSVAGKSRLPGRSVSHSYAANAPPSVSTYHCNYFDTPHYYLGQVTHKYILQGVLRI